ncbi:MAG: hypothetical protein ACR2FH_08775 [Caulobacteraceae bacterium]
MIKTYLYDSEGRDREFELSAEAVAGLAEHHILWTDATAPDAAEVDRLKTTFSLNAQCVAGMKRPATTFSLDNYGD